MTVLLDSWAWIEYFRDGKKADIIEEYVESNVTIFISSVSISEVFRWLLGNETKALAKKLTQEMIHRSLVVPVHNIIAWKAAELKHEHKWGLGDALIYATAQENKSVLVTGDSDFKEIKDVTYLGN